MAKKKRVETIEAQNEVLAEETESDVGVTPEAVVEDVKIVADFVIGPTKEEEENLGNASVIEDKPETKPETVPETKAQVSTYNNQPVFQPAPTFMTPKRTGKVVLVYPTRIVVVDNQGNGYTLRGKKYKGYEVGDTVEF